MKLNAEHGTRTSFIPFQKWNSVTQLLICSLSILISSNSIVIAQEPEVIFSELQDATSIYATQDHLYVVESGKHRLLKLDHDGKLIETLGGLGSGEYQFDQPIDLDATNGLKIYISDYVNNRIQVFDRRFQYLGSITGETAFENRRIKPTQLVVNEFGELLVYDEASKAILKFDENGNYQDSFDLSELYPSKIEIQRNHLVITDKFSGQVGLMTQNGLLREVFPFVKEIECLIDDVTVESSRFLLFLDRLERIELDD